MKKPKLKRELGLFEATMYGVGVILGAGIYALIGEGAGIAGNALWISFIIGAIVASFTGLSYCELSSMMPKEAAEYTYTRKAFGKRFAFIVSWVLIATNTIAAATVALGFGGYFSQIFGTPVIPAAILIIVLFSLLNFRGIRESSNFNIIATLIEGAGLILIIAIGIAFFNPDVNFIYSPAGFTGVMSAAALMFFAYIGFEGVANISEETKKAKNIVPKALIISLAVSTVLYILVAVAAVSVVGWEGLSTSKAPLADVMNQTLGFNASMLMSVIALFATGNTILVSLLVVSRIIYGMAAQKSLPKAFAKIHKKTRTPYIAVFTVMILASAMTFAGDIGLVAQLTTIGIFLVFMAVNLAAIVMRYKTPKAKRVFRMPLNMGKMPLLSVAGFLTSFVMIFYFEPIVWMAEAAVIIAGLLVYEAVKK